MPDYSSVFENGPKPVHPDLTTDEKAFQINLDAKKYGTFAEIGAGQEVARRFFHVGGAAGTIAKTISAYDMTISDGLYGKAERYVTRQRMEAMLDFEFRQLRESLDAKRGETTTFFSFANTIAARSYSRKEEGHGWLGIRFQAQPREAPSEIIIHARLFDRDNQREQEALGVIGVNLIYGAFFHHHEPVVLMASLLDCLTRDRVEVDMIKFTGPAFAQTDNRLMSMQLVSQGLSDAAIFLANGDVVQASEAFYKKPVLMERGSFRPVTCVGLDMLERARDKMRQDPELQGQEPFVVMEMTLHNLMGDNGIDHRDFLARVDILGALGQSVMISNFARYYRVTSFLRRHTANFVGMVMGVPTLQEIFEEKYYQDLDGGILEALGRLFKGRARIFTYPTLIEGDGELRSAESLQVAPHLRDLYAYLLRNRFVESLVPEGTQDLHILPRDVLRMIESGDAEWERLVPERAVALIKERGFFGCRSNT